MPDPFEGISQTFVISENKRWPLGCDHQGAIGYEKQHALPGNIS
jgi:hypothetical protein